MKILNKSLKKKLFYIKWIDICITVDTNYESEDSLDSNGTQTNVSLNRMSFGDKINTSNNESDVKMLESLRSRVYDSMPSSLHSLFSSQNHRYSNEQPVPQVVNIYLFD